MPAACADRNARWVLNARPVCAWPAGDDNSNVAAPERLAAGDGRRQLRGVACHDGAGGALRERHQRRRLCGLRGFVNHDHVEVAGSSGVLRCTWLL